MISFNEYLIHSLIILIVILYFFYTRIYNLHKFLKTIPTPPTKWFLGNFHELIPTSVLLKTLHKYSEKYNGMFLLKLGPFKQVLVASDPDFIHFALNNNRSFGKGFAVKFLRPWLGDGLIIIEGDTWKTHRKLINPGFNFKMLEEFIPTFETCSDIFVKILSKLSGNSNIDLHPYVSRCTFDMICETAMGTKLEAQTNENSKYFESVNEICRIATSRVVSIFRRYDIVFYFTKDYNIQKQLLQYLREYTDRVINIKLEEFKNNKNGQNRKDGEENEKKRKVFLDILIETAFQSQEFTQNDLRDEVNTFMFAGHHTTAAASNFILYCIANHKDVQDKLYKEQQQIFGSAENTRITYATLQEMRFLECVIKEGLRLYSPAVAAGRETKEEITYNGIVLPKGQQMSLFLRGLHMNPQYYPNPENFDPSRFEKADEKQRYTFLPFGTGPRTCIGQKYAMLELKTLISKVVRNFELSPATPPHSIEGLTLEMVLKSVNSLRVGLKLR